MKKEPQHWDKVKTPKGSGAVVARSQTLQGWLVGVKLDKGGDLWKGRAKDVELLESAGESELREKLQSEKGKGS